MTIILRRNETIELNVVEFGGAINLDELEHLARHQAEHPMSAKSDALNVIAPGAIFDGVDFAALDALNAYYRTLYQTIDFQILRRAAWVCRSEVARPMLEHWLRGRNPNDGFSSDVRVFTTLGQGADWLLLNVAETDELLSGHGFVEIARFHAPRTRGAAR
jgi:hypothetical protein